MVGPERKPWHCPIGISDASVSSVAVVPSLAIRRPMIASNGAPNCVEPYASQIA
jgi:hypothetical protein